MVSVYLVLKLGVYIIKLYLDTHQSLHASHNTSKNF